MNYTAELHNVRLLSREGWTIAIGIVYKDSKGRFYDGEEIRTSKIVALSGDVLITLNSTYKLVNTNAQFLENTIH